ncbi:MAG: class I SAM-dependent methyltransferase [Pseudomonadota bacterium]
MTETESPQEAPNEADAPTQSSYNPNQSPVLLSYVAASQGFVPPSPASAYTYCDIGCGQALTLCTLAAANPQARFIGIDPSAGALAQGRAMAKQGGLENVELIEAPFEELGALELPELDYVTLQGIYSRLSDGALAELRTLVGRCLRPGGLLYVEYLALPGNMDVAVMMQVWREFKTGLGGEDDESVPAGLSILESLRAAELPFFKTHPLANNLVQRYSRLGEKRPEGLKRLGYHLLSNPWRPRYFTEMSREMAALELGFVGSTELALNDLELSVPEAHHELFAGLADPAAREVLKDTLRNQQQRRDVFIRSAERRPEEAREALASQFHFVQRPVPQGQEIAVPMPGGGRRELKGPLYAAVNAMLGAEPQNLATLLARKELAAAKPEQITASVQRLMAAGACMLSCSAEVRAPLRVLTGELTFTSAFNEALVRMAAQHLRRVTLASPVTGAGAVQLLPMEAVFVDLIMTLGPDNIVTATKARLEDIQLTFSLDGKAVAARDVDLKTIRAALNHFRSGKLISLFRYAIIESPRSDLMLEGADDAFEFD